MNEYHAQIRGCLTKRLYEDEREARKTLKSIRKKRKLAKFSGLHIYRCLFCPYWHIGH